MPDVFKGKEKSVCLCVYVCLHFLLRCCALLNLFDNSRKSLVFVGKTLIIYHVETGIENLKKLIDHSFEYINNEYIYLLYCYINDMLTVYIVFLVKCHNILMIYYLQYNYILVIFGIMKLVNLTHRHLKLTF